MASLCDLDLLYPGWIMCNSVSIRFAQDLLHLKLVMEIHLSMMQSIP